MHKCLVAGIGLVICGCLSVASCGFTPLYATSDGIIPSEDKTISEETAKIYVAPIANRSGQLMRQKLRALLSGQEQQEKIYTLTVTNTEKVLSEQGYREDNVPTRITLGYTSAFSLAKGDKVLLQDTFSAQSSYNILQSGYSTNAAKVALEKQMLSQLAQRIAIRVSSYLKTANPAANKTVK